MLHNYTIDQLIKTGVYKITCIKNGRFYIGSAAFLRANSPSKLGFNGRLNNHLRALRYNKHKNPILQNSFNLYGVDSFVFEILEFCEPEKCVEREQYYLDTLQPFYPNGFNICKNALNNTKTPSKHRTCSRDVTNLNSDQRIPILQFTLEGEFVKEWAGVTIASKTTGIARASIYNCCRKRYKKAGRFIWKYKDESSIKDYPKLNKYKVRVVNLTNNESTIYNTIAEVCRNLDYCKSTIEIHLKKNLVLGKTYKLEKIFV